ncbi:MAG TPA: dethiobiotin synthase [Chitinophagales bacterium]|nr:dethiobiotin synthase [Chitinophagales bacterium]HMZ34855.1 dethiobiotin synthase [Chitinophagales bacterium]HNC73023.1 dethiobiotin synthase [Chitinophagales bacterium]HNF20130.1 dethiobiotin synthase [Chitinophagales bacterium]HNF52436.1 dethiobiotin synthase [Chitinophagales bacterium]
MKGFFITGIGTDVGKTVVSAIVVEALQADYWKPIQCGNLDFTDSDFIEEYTLHHQTIHDEAYLFEDPVSPHLAAYLSNKNIDNQFIKLPKSNNYLIVEGAGGLMVPLSQNYLIIDLIKQLQLSVIVVSMNYLGSINHTLLTIESLKYHNIDIAGIVFNGDENSSSETFILQHTGVRLLGKIAKADILSKGFIAHQASSIRKNLLPLLSPLPNQDTDTNLPLDYESF